MNNSCTSFRWFYRERSKEIYSNIMERFDNVVREEGKTTMICSFVLLFSTHCLHWRIIALIIVFAWGIQYQNRIVLSIREFAPCNMALCIYVIVWWNGTDMVTRLGAFPHNRLVAFVNLLLILITPLSSRNEFKVNKSLCLSIVLPLKRLE